MGFADRADKPYSMRKVLERWQMRPEDAAYVGDTPYDMQAAREAGLMPIAAAWAETSLVRDGKAGAAHTFFSLDAFMAWLEVF
jgi:phosphoglycolate phosphatase-like HAD superfamily hydrolase